MALQKSPYNGFSSMAHKPRLLVSILILLLGGESFAQPTPSDAVEFISTSYVNSEGSPFGRDHDVVQLSARIYSSGFVDIGVIGGSGSRPLPEFPCTDDYALCWISLLPRLVAVYPTGCFPECGEWRAYGFKFNQDAVRYVQVGDFYGPAITYRVEAPNGGIQFQLVTREMGLVGFSEFSNPDRPSPLPIFWRNSSSGMFFPFAADGHPAPVRNYDGFLDAFGISWEEASAKRWVSE